jgi:KaiC/GvpD/RAD55 family RecA-like ATPase
LTRNTNAGSNLLRDILGVDPPKGYSLLLTGHPGVGKTTFVNNVFSEAMSVTRRGVYVALEPERKEFVKRLPNDAKVAYLDGHSWKAGIASSKYAVKNLSNLNELSVNMMAAAKDVGNSFLYVIDSLSNLAIYCEENEILRFLEGISSRFRARECTGLMVVERGIHSKSFYNMLRQIMDGVLEMRIMRLEGRMRRFVRCTILRGSFHSSKWNEYSLTSDGKFVSLGEVDPDMRNHPRI